MIKAVGNRSISISTSIHKLILAIVSALSVQENIILILFRDEHFGYQLSHKIIVKDGRIPLK